MKNVVIIIIIIVILLGILFFFSQKKYTNENVGFVPKDTTQAIQDSSVSTKPTPQISISDYHIDYDETKALTYLLPNNPNQDQIITHIGYTLAYNERNEEADWVAYVLTAGEANTYRERSNAFKRDPYVTSGSALPLDYSHSGYDKGHLAPAADMRWSAQAMNASFYMSNMTPQEPAFNRGIWKDLEEQVRQWALQNKQLFIVTGPVFDTPASERETIGADKVAVPDEFYKIILDYRQPEFKVISFMIPNEEEHVSLDNFVVTVNEIEKKTGLDFFPQLPDSIENVLESEKNISEWYK
ncbi:MAG TPA: DNA/RNA non-specific endonuclease [Candidatus Cloacimonadota bacterium]|nr:DNA/RNA non-specific endonuclease [Candidatus Cloacimonadota bacterium]